jgi:hypothetical protein
MPAAGSGTARGNSKSNEGTSDKNLGGGSSGGFGSNSLSPAKKQHLDMKYPGASKKKNRQYEASLENIAKVGTMIGSMALGPGGAALNAGVSIADSLMNGQNPIAGALDPFSGRMADVPSSGAGYADSGQKDERMTPAEKLAQQKAGMKKGKGKLSKGFTLLAGAGGTLLGS